MDGALSARATDVMLWFSEIDNPFFFVFFLVCFLVCAGSDVERIHVLQCVVGQVHCFVMPTEIITTVKDGVPRTAISIFTQLLSFE